MGKYLKFKDLEIDRRSCTAALITSIEERETQNGAPYCLLSMTDGDTEIKANVWNTEKASLKVAEKTVISVELYPKIYKDSVSYEVYHMGPAPNGSKVSDFVLKAPYSPEQMYQEILNMLHNAVPDAGSLTLVTLVETIYEENKNELLRWSASKGMHHNCLGGLLYHIFRMLRMGIVAARVYQELDKEVLLCAIALHDIGKLKELYSDEIGAADYTVDGALFGHTYMGLEMISGAAQLYDFNDEKVRLLMHCVGSHHGLKGWGALASPSIPEAMLLCQIDRIDGQMYQFEDSYRRLEEGELSEKVFGLDTRVYKPLMAG